MLNFKFIWIPDALWVSATYPQPGSVVFATPHGIWRMAISIMIKMDIMRNPGWMAFLPARRD